MFVSLNLYTQKFWQAEKQTSTKIITGPVHKASSKYFALANRLKLLHNLMLPVFFGCEKSNKDTN